MKFSMETCLSLFFLAVAIIIIFVWVPLDTGTGMIEKVRRQLIIGDALAPTVAGIVILLGSLLMLWRPSQSQFMSPQNLMWILALLIIFVVSLTIMRYAGPLAVFWSETGYRPLRATPPWSYMGFLLGGTTMVGGVTSLVSRRLSFKYFLIGFIASLVIALVYDVPFDDLVLPPNGDI